MSMVTDQNYIANRIQLGEIKSAKVVQEEEGKWTASFKAKSGDQLEACISRDGATRYFKGYIGAIKYCTDAGINSKIEVIF